MNINIVWKFSVCVLFLLGVLYSGHNMSFRNRRSQINEGFACVKKMSSWFRDNKKTNSESLVFVINFDAREYSLDQKNIVKAIFTNTSNEDYYIAIGDLEEGLRFRAKKGSAGDIICKSVLLSRPAFHGENYYYLLKKHESKTIGLEFSKLRSVSATGEYQITAEYWNCTAGNKHTKVPFWKFWKTQDRVWIGGVESNVVSIKFVK